MIEPTTYELTCGSLRDVPVQLTERGAGHPVLLLHGGGGPQTVLSWADRLAERCPARVLTPVHPGFGGTLRPDGLDSVADLADLYVALLEALDLSGVAVIGNSIGGWIAAEMVTRVSSRIGCVVLLDAVGLEVPGHPVVDFFTLTPAEVAERTFADPATYALDPASLTPDAQAALAANRRTLGVYAADGMADATLGHRLAAVTTPTLVVWGEADGIADPQLGRAYAEAIPGARFELIPGAGHLPQVETPDALIDVVWPFLSADGPVSR